MESVCYQTFILKGDHFTVSGIRSSNSQPKDCFMNMEFRNKTKSNMGQEIFDLG